MLLLHYNHDTMESLQTIIHGLPFSGVFVMYVVIVYFETKHDFQEHFAKRVLQQAQDSLDKETDCHVFDVCRDPAHANRFILYEVYGDEAAFKNHLKTEHFLAFDAECRNWVASKRVEVFHRMEQTS